MTPTHKSPSHIENEGYSNVFHRDTPGKVVAKFFGDNHVADAIEHAQTNHNKAAVRVPTIDEVVAWLKTASSSERVAVQHTSNLPPF